MPQNISEDSQEMPQSRSTALLRQQKKERLGKNKGKPNATYETYAQIQNCKPYWARKKDFKIRLLQVA